MTIIQYNIKDITDKFSDFKELLPIDILDFFRDIKKQNVFNPTKFYNKKISFNNWRKNLEKQTQNENKNEQDIILEKIKTILNKFTAKTYNILYSKLIETIDNNETILKITIDFLFNRSLIQKIYCGMYARLCNNLYSNFGENVKKIILQKCKENFYSQKNIIATNVDTDYDILCKILKQKKKFIGIFHLVGNLYREKMVDEKVIENYFKLLLESFDTHLDDDIREKYVECFKELFLSVYKQLKINITDEKYNYYLEKINYLMKKPGLNNREKFMLMDILEEVS